MNVYRSLDKLPDFRNAVVTIGSFDGVHQGHQEILQRVVQLAKKMEGESILVTFHPHPRMVTSQGKTDLRLINTIDEKVALLERFGIDNVVIVPFTKTFASQSPEVYIKDFLVEKIKAKHIVIGYDHKFGKNRAGNLDLLKSMSEEHEFIVEEITKQEVDDIAVSSTKIRQAIKEGAIKNANLLLGHQFSLSGTVILGQQIGRSIGFPTANIDIEHPYKIIPAYGIYAVYVYHDNMRYEGMLYIGEKPTIKEKQKHRVIEVNIFNFEKDIYNQAIKIEFVEKIREDQDFDGLEGLKQQLINDKAATLAILDSTSKDMQHSEELKMPKVAVAILNYNGRHFLEQFIPTLLLHTHYKNVDFYVIDNASTDDSVTYLENNFPSIKIIYNPENGGFSKGYNEGLNQIDSDYYVLLNSDVEVTESWIAPVIELMERDKSVGICQPKVKMYDDTSKFEYAGAAGGQIDKYGYTFCRGRLVDTVEVDEGQYDTTQEICWASGAALFIKGKLYHQLGGLDELHFAHMEEIDLCWRAQRAGFKVMCRPKSVVYHVGGGTLKSESPFKTFLNFRNNLFLLTKNERLSKLYWLIPLRLVLDGLAGILFLIKGQFKNIGAIIKAHFSFYGHFTAIMKQRRRYNEAIRKISINRPQKAGHYPKSMMWQYFVKGKRKFSDLT